ncbi:hypothetical protein [Burkholderia sp. A9]|uniref:hypothetical protein n=1 Tax=Burkholderia sp. A9 TaxID=1365108 RepID=UPI001269DCAC|nr:hypothetical protein [Burkholderia sp. A9]
MSRLKREVIAIAYFSFFLLVLFVMAGFFEFLFWPALMSLRGGDGYHLPQIDRLYKWVRLISLVVPPCSLVLWLYEKSASGR